MFSAILPHFPKLVSGAALFLPADIEDSVKLLHRQGIVPVLDQLEINAFQFARDIY